MTMAWIAVGTAAIGAGASIYGSKKQSDAAKKAAGMSMDQFQLINQQQMPFMQGGYGAMGRLNTLLGLNPNPRAMQAPVSRFTPGQGYMPTPGGGVQPIMQMGPQTPSGGAWNSGSGYVGIPERAPNARLNQLLALRASNGDQQAQRILRGMV